ncbi:transposase InsN for insertion sequence element IS911A [Escherichia coli M056]|nr:transposase InsN for insertion sequence element IS911A [Escherichia coli M056]
MVKQLRDERQGKTPKASPMTPEQIEIRELRKKLQRIETENEGVPSCKRRNFRNAQISCSATCT